MHCAQHALMPKQLVQHSPHYCGSPNNIHDDQCMHQIAVEETALKQLYCPGGCTPVHEGKPCLDHN